MDENGTEHTIPESNTINLLIDTFDNKTNYTPELKSDAYREMETWWKWCDEVLKPMIDRYKYGAHLKFDTTVHAVHTAELKKLVQVLEDTLCDKEFLIEARLTLADIAIIPFIRQIMRTREGEFDFTPYPRVYQWTECLIKTDWFQNEVMKRTCVSAHRMHIS